MIIDKKDNLTGKNRTIMMAETQSERWVSWIRIILSIGYAFFALFCFLLTSSPLKAFIIQVVTAAIVSIYSIFFLYFYNNKLVQGNAAFFMVFLDVAAITAILWSYSIANPIDSNTIISLYGIYLFAITFAALHYRASLAIYSGIISVLAYALFYYNLSFEHPTSSTSIHVVFIIQIIIIMIASIIGAIISRNNFLNIGKIVSSESRYHKLVHRLPEMLFTLDSKGNFLWANIAAYSLLGIPAKVLPGKNIKQFMMRPELLKLDREIFRGTFEITDFNGVHKFVDCIIQEAKSENKYSDTNPVRWEGIMTDVTERELALSQREEMINRLYEYQKMESLAALASGMAHDFNNILQTVNDVSATVLKESKEEKTIQRMTLLSQTMEDARFLISELLTLGRKKPLDHINLNLQKFLGKIIPQYAQQLGSQYEIEVLAPEEPLWIQADADYLKRVFQNLIGNSRDAMPQGGKITIECFAERKEGSVNKIVIRVSDTGEGISPEVAKKIFDPFFTTKKPGKGTGLGLALVQRIISLHRGQIFLEETSRKGTTFRIEIPESETQGDDADTKDILLSRRITTVLLLEDDLKIRNILKFFLKEFGYGICEASNIEEAMAELKRNLKDCNVVVMDWKLGADTPTQVISTLREIKPTLIFMVVSGYPPDTKSIKELKIHRWFTKPYDKNQLDLEIQKALFLAADGKKKESPLPPTSAVS